MAQPEKPIQRRVFVLEQGVVRPLDYAVCEGRHELRDCGVELAFDGERVALSWQGFGPAAFLLPGARQLRKGNWTTVEEGARVSWAGRDWVFLQHAMADALPPPSRGVCLNSHGTGFPVNAALLSVVGKDHGNFYRVRTEPYQLTAEVQVRGRKDDEGVTLEATVHRVADTGQVRLDGQALAPDTTATMTGNQTLEIDASERGPALTVQTVLA
jgi:hypothetical protein